ncbi:hypothetical protein NP233_g10280 [Leucocoprinus birnbaumii]|uniref:Uncharacterized protein n=1 Tax=Leucocoprinus birnbaumii TaxID=56174 RepID=A0AAD5VIV6_9AGAR|nr:hypothetical protein NP233_g10280 [Leucocoprinus birnbaumii]
MSTEVAFCLAMQRIFKAGMKCTAFKGTHAFISDIEEDALLETGHTELSPDQAPLIPTENILLNEDEETPEPGPHKDSSLFKMLEFPHVDDPNLTRLISPSADNLLLGMDSESEDDSLVNTGSQPQKTGFGDIINIDLDDSDEDDFQGTAPVRTVKSPAASLGKKIPAHPIPRPTIESVLGINDSSLDEHITIYVADIDHKLPPKADYMHLLDQRSSLDALASHDVQQTRSGDTGNSQEKGYDHHMPYPGHKWTRAAPSTDPLVVDSSPFQASLSVNQVHLAQRFDFDEMATDLEVDDGGFDLMEGHSTELEEELRGADPNTSNLSIHSNLNPPGHAPNPEDFLDVLSEELWSDEELYMDGRRDRGLPPKLNSRDCIIDDGMITDLPIVQSIEEHILGDEDFILVAEGPGPRSNNDGVRSLASKLSQIDFILVDESEAGGCVNTEDETGFIELIT